MSEPYSAFLKLQIAPARFSQWLDGPVRLASTWADWDSIGGLWHPDAGGEPTPLSEQNLGALLTRCDTALARCKDNRTALRSILDTAEDDSLKMATFNRSRTRFVAGSLTYSENLNDFLFFLAAARGAADMLGPKGHGIIVIHNYIWGKLHEQNSIAAIRLGPEGKSEFMSPGELVSAAGAFQPIAEAILSGEKHPDFQLQDQLDQI